MNFRKIRRILVAVKDPTAASGPALLKAAQIAKASKARIELFHCITAPLYGDAFTYWRRDLADIQQNIRAEHLARLEKLAAGLRRHRIRVDVAAEWDYPVHEAVIRRAVESRADLIIVDQHAGSRLAQPLMRLADWELIRHSVVPVLIVKQRKAYHRPVVLAAIDPQHSHAKPSRLDPQILRAGGLLARDLRGTLHVAHAFWPHAALSMAADGISTYASAELVQQARQYARRTFDQALRRSLIPPWRRYLVERSVVDGVLQAVRKTGCAIVVMGAVSRSGVKRLFIGNTAEALLGRLPCDVLVVKPPRFPNRIGARPRGARLVTGVEIPV